MASKQIFNSMLTLEITVFEIHSYIHLSHSFLEEKRVIWKNSHEPWHSKTSGKMKFSLPSLGVGFYRRWEVWWVWGRVIRSVWIPEKSMGLGKTKSENQRRALTSVVPSYLETSSPCRQAAFVFHSLHIQICYLCSINLYTCLFLCIILNLAMCILFLPLSYRLLHWMETYLHLLWVSSTLFCN